ncbi:cytochrome P450 family protein [Perilla frutescens var. hirtella]|uniref:Cytochrome P450 family protein n=1 Tax=Perilla frutescens var. hirtella TaxID=608512 RepID=A0AAD4IMG5_PERFH|nr:cytochrome P450 family protein [Perilla frutescens var. hirtella]
MLEKATLALLSNFVVQWWFKILAIAIFLGIMILGGIDGLSIYTFYNFAVVKLNGSELLSQSYKDSNFTNISVDLPKSNQILDTPSNLSPQVSSNLLPWITVEYEANYTSNLLARWLAPGGEPCRDSRTVGIKIPRLDGNSGNVELLTGDVHEFVFHTFDDLGLPHCLGGDYFETDLSSERWKARPPIKDMGNGSYSFSLQVHPDFAGDYNLTIILLFRHFQGLKFSPERFVFDKVLRVVPIKFLRSASHLPEIRQCKESDYFKDVWSGRWTRLARNGSCPISNDGRYRCQEPSFPCQKPWCDGALGLLESNGWVYSAHCSFKLFKSEDAWNCLNNRWIFWWGDSNHCDTIRNILNFILDVHDVAVVPRIFDRNITNPNNPSQVVRFTSIFNGHPNDTGNYEGLNSLINAEYRELLKGYFSHNIVPDTIIMNSGLHDGVHWHNIRQFVRGADYAAAFWAEVKQGVEKRGVEPPELIYRTTVATGGYARRLAFNPHKMEAFNGVVLDKMRQHGALNRVIDDFDMTYPWHYDNRCNDGVHYGRAPLKMKWKDGQIGHQYFVDLMLGHVLINALCVR